MLILSRKKGERILIGNDIEVTIVDVKGNRVKLGFTAPAEVAIHRAEVHQRMDPGENEAPRSEICRRSLLRTI